RPPACPSACRPAPVVHGRVRLRLRPAAAALGLHLALLDERGRGGAGGDRADREYRPGLHAEIPLGPGAGPGTPAARARALRPTARVAAGDPALAGCLLRAAGAV